jgi:hypothetical protein
MSLLHDIRDLILDIEPNTYTTNLPQNAVDNVCLISSIDGRPPIEDLENIIFRNPSIKIYIRDLDYDNAILRMESIITLLHNINNEVVIAKVNMESDILSLGNDEKYRSEIFCIFSVITQ